MSIRYTQRLAEVGVLASVGSKGDSYDNAAAESVIGLYKTEVIKRRGPWKHLDDVEFATLEWVDWYNKRRLHSALDHVPPVEHEADHHRRHAQRAQRTGHAALAEDPAAQPSLQ